MTTGFGVSPAGLPKGLEGKFARRWASMQRSFGSHRGYVIELSGYSVSVLQKLCDLLSSQHPGHCFSVTERVDKVKLRGIDVKIGGF